MADLGPMMDPSRSLDFRCGIESLGQEVADRTIDVA